MKRDTLSLGAMLSIALGNKASSGTGFKFVSSDNPLLWVLMGSSSSSSILVIVSCCCSVSVFCTTGLGFG